MACASKIAALIYRFPQVNLSPRLGEPAVFVITVTRDDAPLRLDGFTCMFAVKALPTDRDDAAIFHLTTGSGITHMIDAGEARIVVPANTLGSLDPAKGYFWSVKVFDGGGFPFTPEGLEGRLYPRPSMIQAISV